MFDDLYPHIQSYPVSFVLLYQLVKNGIPLLDFALPKRKWLVFDPRTNHHFSLIFQSQAIMTGIPLLDVYNKL